MALADEGVYFAIRGVSVLAYERERCIVIHEVFFEMVSKPISTNVCGVVLGRR